MSWVADKNNLISRAEVLYVLYRVPILVFACDVSLSESRTREKHQSLTDIKKTNQNHESYVNTCTNYLKKQRCPYNVLEPLLCDVRVQS